MPDPRETLARIRKQADAATEGPWEAEQPPGPGEDPMRSICVYPKEGGGAITYVQPLEADAEFIASARTDVPWLLEQVELRDKALEAVLDLHKPGRTFHGHGFSQPLCTCGAPLPCPTAAAATNALNGATP